MTDRTDLLHIDPLHPQEDLISRAARVLQRHGVIGYPTETVYGIGCNIFAAAAVERIYQLKQRESARAMIVIAADVLQIGDLVARVPERAERLMENFWPGPLTIIFPASEEYRSAVTGGLETIAIRIPDSPICLSLIKACGFPIVSTSANLSGGPPATTAREVLDAFGGKLDLIIDGGPSAAPTPSTVVDITVDPVRILREGVLSALEIQTVLEVG